MQKESERLEEINKELAELNKLRENRIKSGETPGQPNGGFYPPVLIDKDVKEFDEKIKKLNEEKERIQKSLEAQKAIQASEEEHRSARGMKR